MTWSVGYAGEPGSGSGRTGFGTPTRPGCCVEERDGEREGAAGPRLDHNHGRHLRPPDHRGRQGDLGGCRLVHRERGPVVSASTERSARTWPGLLEKLMTVVRTEFRVDLYVPDPDHPVLGRGTCPVPDCDRSPTEHGLCPSHGQRWQDRGRPELTEFVTDPGPPVNGRRDLTRCTVPGCRYGSSGLGLCIRQALR